jgi:hypothetical protein
LAIPTIPGAPTIPNTIVDPQHIGSLGVNQPSPQYGDIETPKANRLACGAPGHINLGGEDYLVGQATQQDMTAFAEEAIKVNSRVHDKRLLALLKDLGDYELAKRFLADSEAQERASFDAICGDKKMDDASYGFNKAAMSADGAAFLFWMLTRKNHPGLTMATVKQCITEDNASAIGAQLLFESGLGQVGPNSGGGTGTN